MKRSILFAFLSGIVLSACHVSQEVNDGHLIQKRKYNQGFYLKRSTINKAENAELNQAKEVKIEIREFSKKSISAHELNSVSSATTQTIDLDYKPIVASTASITPEVNVQKQVPKIEFKTSESSISGESSSLSNIEHRDEKREKSARLFMFNLNFWFALAALTGAVVFVGVGLILLASFALWFILFFLALAVLLSVVQLRINARTVPPFERDVYYQRRLLFARLVFLLGFALIIGLIALLIMALLGVR